MSKPRSASQELMGSHAPLGVDSVGSALNTGTPSRAKRPLSRLLPSMSFRLEPWSLLGGVAILGRAPPMPSPALMGPRLCRSEAQALKLVGETRPPGQMKREQLERKCID